MPKKTKKEKILAMYHKKLRMLEDKQIKTPIIISEPTVINEIKKSNQYFFSDLKKSLLLIVLILGIEVSLYAAKLIK